MTDKQIQYMRTAMACTLIATEDYMRKVLKQELRLANKDYDEEDSE